MPDLSIDALTQMIIGSAFEVHKELGTGFLEKVYENALKEELVTRGMSVEVQKPVSVYYKGNNVGEYFADLVVEDRIIIELKAVEKLHDVHEIQLKNYLRATDIEIGLLINFGRSVEVKRKYVSNEKAV